MRKYKRLISLFITFCIFLNFSVFSFGEIKQFDYVNIYSDYFIDLQYCIENGYINGGNENTFEPERPITRAELVKILAIMSNMPDENSFADRINCLADVSDKDWSYKYIDWALNNGIAKGTNIENGLIAFSPNNYVTGEQLKLFISRYLELNGCKNSISINIESEHYIKRKEVLKLIVEIKSNEKENKENELASAPFVTINCVGDEEQTDYQDAVKSLKTYISQYIPEEIIKKFTEQSWEINILSDNEFDEKYGRIYSAMTAFVSKRIDIRVSDIIPDVICHEFGHVLQDMYDYDSEHIEKLYSLYANKIVNIKRSAYMSMKISSRNTYIDYAKNNKFEFFAESFMLYCLAKDELKNCDKCYSFINRIVTKI